MFNKQGQQKIFPFLFVGNRAVLMNIGNLKLLLREMVESELVKGRIRDALKRALPLVKHIAPRGADVSDAIDQFIDENSDVWNRLSGYGRISFLGSGRQGSAFSLGDYVLKLQSGLPRSAEIQGSLYAGDEDALGLPNIYDTGVMTSPAGDVGWSLIEKFSDVGELSSDTDWIELWRQISDGIALIVKKANRDVNGRIIRSPNDQKSFMSLPTADVVAELKNKIDASLASSIAEKYELSANWFSNFLKMLKSNYSRGMVDFKPDNMGIRRNGRLGEIVLFDAASAKKRVIKKWEP